ncbi:cytochrome c family protein [Dongia sp.]|uniref:c-type cytochrome n=1 Tax=Dongia sp. TaxID=1977262 RepID=UPI0035B001D2
MKFLASGLAAFAAMTLIFSQPGANAQDLKSGEAVFKQCTACHALEAGKNKLGPSLHNVFGRSAGQAEGFAYSDAMAGSGLTWDEATLAEYLRAPKKLVPGTKMIFAGVKNEAKLQDLIAYLKQATQ